ncbi:protein FAM83G-like isoform X1 [Synchiropus splendidus]|uniref:protein FAM83G-like isoform X1 n=1 Tax=Synchiropus splendidus TaxID=270530 RepID=UPI00237D9BF8|nr:protein FAM83G-like isoform X1 [Synchiropus splendidus]
MALSQLQCLDDNHVNLRTTESKPEFQYCEDQRLGLETLLAQGREAFAKFLEDRGLRGFLSDLEQETLTRETEPFDPDADLFPEGADEKEPPLSQDYWPELSDQSTPQMDLGWPDSESYRGVTRTTVYSQPPQEGQAHIKEIVRKMIAQAQKVIAVVMDVFTDVDIFRDLLDISFKKKVSVYILVERKTLPHFLSMCHRADMHAGHLKHLRVRCTGGREFYTRSCTKVCGRLGHRFMFIDGDKAVSGSYSFTWMSSRLDRNLITVVTGQAVDTFDRLFQCLYMTSSHVDLQQAATKPEPLPEPIPQRAPAPPPSALIARKLHNPKYSLVVGNSSPIAAASTNHPADQAQNRANSQKIEAKKGRRKRGHEAIAEAPPLHPGLENLEKAHLVEYLPTWPEPDPSSDVIGFINIVDTSRPAQVHLQRSERFGVSQAIKFSSPLAEPKARNTEAGNPKEPRQCESTQDATQRGDSVQRSTAGAQSSAADPAKESKPLKTDPAHPASACPSTTTSHSETPADGSAQPTAQRETPNMDVVLTPLNDSTDDDTNKQLSDSHAEEQDSPLQPSETAKVPADKAGSSRPLSTPSPLRTPPTPKPRTVHLCLNGALERQSAVAGLKWKPETKDASNSTGEDSGQHNTDRPKNNDHVGSLDPGREAQEEESLPGSIRLNGTEETHEYSGELPKTNADHQHTPDVIIPREGDPKTESLSSAAGQAANLRPRVTADEVSTQGHSEMFKVYHAKSSQPQVISYVGEHVVEMDSSHAVATNTSPSARQSRPTLAEATHSCEEDTQRTTSGNQEEASGPPGQLPPAATLAPEPSRSQYTFRRISTPEGSRTPTPDSGPLKSGFRTPTPLSDGYVSSKEDSTLSTTSDEYYECSESLFNDRNTYRGHAPREDQTDATSPVLEKQEKPFDCEKQRKRHSEATAENDGNTSPKVTQRPAQVPKRQRLPNSSPEKRLADGEAKTQVATGGLNSRKMSFGAEWQVLIPNSAEKPKVAELEETDGKKEVQGQDSSPRAAQQPRPPLPASAPHRLTPHAHGGQPQNHPVERMLLKNPARAPPARPPPPRAEGSQVELQNQQQPAFLRVPPLQEKRPSPASSGSFLRANLQLQHSAKSQKQMKSEGEERKQDEGRLPFGITLGKLHKITSLKDKKGKKSSGPPAEARKSTG